jgi:magnesium chelatase accessory protein
MTRRLNWTSDGKDWPNRAHSRFMDAGACRWHVQRAGKGEGVLLLHGTGASTHSWAGLFPLLAERFDVLAMDSLDGMTDELKALIKAERFVPGWIIGHSAGAAIAVRLAPQLQPLPHGVISLNGALKPFGGPAALIAPVMAKALAINPLVHHALARGGRDPARVARLIEGTGSRPGADYLEFYGRLFGDARHVSGTLSMMANWNVSGLIAPFVRAGIPMHQIVGLEDRAVPPSHAEELAGRHRTITLERLPGLGHLAHEEDAPRVAAAILAVLKSPEVRVRKSGT